jgi:hypothetical protein
MQRWRGLKALVIDAVEHGSRAVERVQREMAAVPFDILEQIPPLAAPTKEVRVVYEASLTGVHRAVRLVNRGVSRALDVALDIAESREQARKREQAGDQSGPPNTQ